MSRREPLDQQERTRAIEDAGPHLAVEAGAGTGKTTLLVGRIVQGVIERRFELGGLAAITFTRKAAAQLRSRLREGIRLAIEREKGGDPEVLEALVEARRSLPRARVSTIHSFCTGILRRFPFAAGLDPGFEIVPDSDQSEYLASQWRSWLRRTLECGERRDAVSAAASWGVSLEIVEKASRTFVEHPDGMIGPMPEERSAESVWRDFREGWNDIARRIAAARKPGRDEPWGGGIESLVDLLGTIEALDAEDRIRWIANRRDAKQGFKLPEVGRSGGRASDFRDKEELAELKADVKAWRQVEIPALLEAYFAPFAVRLAASLAEFRDGAARERIEQGKLLHHDLLEIARRVLSDPRSEALDTTCRELRALFVDEYQDTDPVQADIVRLFTGHERGPEVFLVGDPKQSIYRFRRADVLTYSAQVRTLESSGLVARIGVNFRSTDALLGIVNAIGRELFEPEERSESQANWQDLTAYADAAGDERRGASLVVTPLEADSVAGSGGDDDAEEAKGGATAADWARGEAASLAQELSAAMREGISPGEMAVIFSSSGRTSILEEELDRAGVPYRQEKSQDFYRRSEVVELSHVIRAMSEPWNELAVVSALRSDYLGISDTELARHHACGGSFVLDGPGATSSADGGDGAVSGGLDMLRRLAALQDRLSPAELLREVLRETRMSLLLRRIPHGDRAAANLRKLTDQAAAHWERGGQGLPDFARWLGSRVLGSTSVEPESAPPEGEERVQLMTVHAAKGLEWKVVGLFDVHAQTGKHLPPAFIDRRTGGMHVRFASGLRSPGYDEAREEENRLEREERVRLLYVAMTRAAERLLIPFPSEELDKKGKNGSFLSVLRGSPYWRSIESAARGETNPPAGVEVGVAGRGAEVPKSPSPPAPDASAVREAEERRESWAAEREATIQRASGTTILLPSAKRGGESPEMSSARERRADEPSPRRVGIAVHEALCRLFRDGDFDRVEAVAAAEALEAGLGEESVPAVERLVRRALESETARRAMESNDAVPELPFVWKPELEGARETIEQLSGAAVEAARRLIVEGVIDLVFDEGGGRWRLADWKTDAWETEEKLDELVDRYAGQVRLYALGLTAALGEPVEEARLVFLGGPELREVSIDVPAG